MQGLAISLLGALQEPAHATTLLIDSVAVAFHAHILGAYCGLPGDGSFARAALAPWQLRRVREFIDAHLNGDPSVTDLARECRLSESHFARAFKHATGVPPHRWMMKRRIERAKQLLLQGNLAIAEIALACGFVDQSHLTRNFVRAEGCGPGKWRWLRRN
jgi:AraC family transcriptional regulator